MGEIAWWSAIDKKQTKKTRKLKSRHVDEILAALEGVK